MLRRISMVTLALLFAVSLADCSKKKDNGRTVEKAKLPSGGNAGINPPASAKFVVRDTLSGDLKDAYKVTLIDNVTLDKDGQFRKDVSESIRRGRDIDGRNQNMTTEEQVVRFEKATCIQLVKYEYVKDSVDGPDSYPAGTSGVGIEFINQSCTAAPLKDANKVIQWYKVDVASGSASSTQYQILPYTAHARLYPESRGILVRTLPPSETFSITRFDNADLDQLVDENLIAWDGMGLP